MRELLGATLKAGQRFESAGIEAGDEFTVAEDLYERGYVPEQWLKLRMCELVTPPPDPSDAAADFVDAATRNAAAHDVSHHQHRRERRQAERARGSTTAPGSTAPAGGDEAATETEAHEPTGEAASDDGSSTTAPAGGDA